jgi:hypothetical protein
MEFLEERVRQYTFTMEMLEHITLPRTLWASFGAEFHMKIGDGQKKSAMQVLSMPDVTLERMQQILQNLASEDESKSALGAFRADPLVWDTVEAACKYMNYLTRQVRSGNAHALGFGS